MWAAAAAAHTGASQKLNLATFFFVNRNGGPSTTSGPPAPLMILYLPSLPAVNVSPTLPLMSPEASAEAA